MSKPITRKEEYLAAAAGDKVDYPAYPMTREEAYLQRIAEGGSVEANPEEEPTGTLEKLKVGDGVYAVPSGGGGGGTSDYSALNNKPQINGVTLTGNKTTEDLNLDYNDLKNRPTIPSAQIQSDWEQTDTSKADFIKNKPSIPDDLADLNDDASHRTVTDTEKSTWNGKSNFSGDYNDLQNKPTIPDPQVQADWNQTDVDAPDYIKNKPSVPSGQVQSDWAQTTNTEPDYIKNKPSLGSAASKNVPSTGDAGSGEVVMGNDSRLSDSRPASDVSSWAKQATKPSYTANEVGAIPSTDKGANGGVATLGNDGIVPSSQLPSMFDGDYNSLTNKPTLGTAAAKDVPSAGNASLTEVVMGSDSRLSDDRNAKDVYSWAKAATKPTYTATEVGAIPSTDKGANGGVAELDSNGLVPASQLPSYVDDVLSYASQSAFPATGETGKIYIAEDTNKTYRWSGSAYVEISESLALGETSSTAYRGDRGKTAYDHSQITGNPHGTTKGDVGLSNVPNVSTNDQTPTFTEASTRNNIASGEKLSVIFGKIAKFFNDLKTVAFTGSFSDLSNKPENANTFQGTIAEWNQLTTAEKKAYDHASLTGAGGGEYNVDKSTGDLVPTAGMPSEYPASQVMMSDGVTSVEDALDNLNKPSGSGAANRLAFREEITEITDEMWASIANGTFDKVHVGMHYTAASGRKYWFADADYYFGKSTPEQTSHHMLVVEDEISHTAQHQTTNVTTGGATASLIYTNTLPGIQSELNADFGESHILTQSLYLTNAISNNVASGGAYIDKKAALLNICQVMGHGLGYTEGTGQYLNALLRERQLSLFQAMPETIVARDKTTQERQWYWCDDVISGSAFGIVLNPGYATSATASSTRGVRRAFLIG